MSTFRHAPWAPLLAAALLTLSTAAAAAPVATNSSISTAFNGTTWYLRNTVGTCTGVGGFGFNDADSAGTGDAYDEGWSFMVDGLWVDAPSADLTGNILTTAPVSRSGLNANVQHYYSPTSSLARIMLNLQNPAATPTTVNVQVPINFGSDNGTIYRMTSSGDATVTTADRWIVSSDGGPFDPVNTTVFYGPGTPSVVPSAYTTTVFDCSGTPGAAASFNVTVPAGATRSLMFFAGLGGVTAANNTVASAVAAASLFNSNATLAADWLTGLSATDQRNVVNWALNPFTTCAATGATGTKLTLCQKACESGLTGTSLTGVIKMYVSLYKEQPACAL